MAKEMSTPEKEMLCQIIDESPILDYPIVKLEMPEEYEAEMEYEIPAEDKEKILKELWPFATPVTLETIFWDLHEQAFFKMCGFKVIRSRNRNFIASPYYSHSGGLACDFISDASDILDIKRITKK